MGITEWVAVLVIFAVVYCLIKRYETRLVLIGSGLLLCLISWNLVGGLNAFAKSMTNASLVMAICGSMGFASLLSTQRLTARSFTTSSRRFAVLASSSFRSARRLPSSLISPSRQLPAARQPSAPR